MKSRHFQQKIVLLAAWLLALSAAFAYASVNRVIQERYRSSYENKALFMKVPIFSERQYVYISGQTFRHDQAPAATPRYKVGDQLRVLGIDFGGDEIKFKLGAIAGTAEVELIFKFDSPLQDNFPNSGVFDNALASTFTEGLKYTEIDDAKRAYVEQEFDRAAREIAATSGTSRDAVLKYVAPKLPVYQDAMRDIENLQNKNMDLGKQLMQAQTENRKLETESKSQQAEISKLRTQAAGLQEKIDNSTTQVLRLGEDLRSAKGVSQNSQRELNNLQRSLKMKVDPNRDLASQIADLGQLALKTQKENEDLQGENGSLRANLEKEQSDNARLSGENQDLNNTIRKKDEMLKTLTSKEDSLARRYFVLQQAKDNLDNVAQSIANLSTRTVEEKTEGGYQSGKINAYLGSVLLGSFEWRFPENVTASQDGAGEVSFARESIDYVRVNATERRLLQSLGERLKLTLSLSSSSDAFDVKPDKENSQQEIGERDRATWRWRISSHGAQDGRLLLSAQLVNKNGDDIPLLQSEKLVESSNLVREVRGYLQPVPIVIGAVLGSLLAAIAGLFRRGRRAGRHSAGAPPEPSAYGGRKQL